MGNVVGRYKAMLLGLEAALKTDPTRARTMLSDLFGKILLVKEGEEV